MAHSASALATRSRRLNARETPEEERIREREVLTLSKRSRKIFVEVLLNPPKPNEKALAAAKRFSREVH
jgi:hypothetical protein